MRFIGNKENLVDKIYQVIQDKDIKGKSFFDFFAGTTNVGRYFKNKGYQIYSSDLLYFSYVLQQAYINNNTELRFEKLLSNLKVQSQLLFTSPLFLVVEYLNHLKPIESFIYNNYTPSGTSELEQPRMYFSDENGKIIDSIRLEIENWHTESLIERNEYFVLLACLIETVPFYANVSGVFAAFQKKWDPRAVKKLVLRPIKLIFNDKINFSHNVNSIELLNINADIYYLDHEYLDILDFSIAGQRSARQFEVRIVELLNQIIIAKHLSGGNRPEIIGYNPQENPEDCIIMDSKAYGQGFPIPANERDKMIRYIEEYNTKDEILNSNKWWENYKSPNYPISKIKFGFVSSKFIGQFLNQLTYINNRTNINGCAITAETLLRKVDNVLGNENDYDLTLFFNELGSNMLVE